LSAARVARLAPMLGLLLAAQAVSAAPAFGDYWYGGIRGGIVTTDQNYRNDGTLYALGIGRTFGPEYALEIEATYDKLDFGIDYGLRHRSLEANWLTINPEPLWHPYFLVGLGVIEFDGPAGLPRPSGHNAMFNLGVGGMWEIVVPNRLMLRADMRLRYDLNDTHQPGQAGFGDGVFTLGLVMPFR
jgi:hypothetical protein